MLPIKIKVGKDFDCNKQNEPPILQLYNMKYQQGESVTDFYNQYREQVIAKMKKQGDIIAWKNNSIMSVNEEISPVLEDLILANVLRRIDVHLPRLVQHKYKELIGRTKSLMDYKEEIFASVPAFFNEIGTGQHADSKIDAGLNARYA